MNQISGRIHNETEVKWYLIPWLCSRIWSRDKTAFHLKTCHLNNQYSKCLVFSCP